MINDPSFASTNQLAAGEPSSGIPQESGSIGEPSIRLSGDTFVDGLITTAPSGTAAPTDGLKLKEGHEDSFPSSCKKFNGFLKSWEWLQTPKNAGLRQTLRLVPEATRIDEAEKEQLSTFQRDLVDARLESPESAPGEKLLRGLYGREDWYKEWKRLIKELSDDTASRSVTTGNIVKLFNDINN